MRSANSLLNRKRWPESPDLLMTVGLSTLACAFFIAVVPRSETLLLETVAGFVLVIRASVLRIRVSRASQLCLRWRERRPLASTLRTGRFRFFDRYELVLIIGVLLAYGSLSGFLRPQGGSGGLVRVLPLAMFGFGLMAKSRILRWIASRRKTDLGTVQQGEIRSDS